MNKLDELTKAHLEGQLEELEARFYEILEVLDAPDERYGDKITAARILVEEGVEEVRDKIEAQQWDPAVAERVELRARVKLLEKGIRHLLDGVWGSRKARLAEQFGIDLKDTDEE